MSLFTPAQRQRAEALHRLTYCNPFMAERIVCEREALGEEFEDPGAEWNLFSDVAGGRHNLVRLRQVAEGIVAAARRRLGAGGTPGDRELALYEDAAVYALYYRSMEGLSALVEAGENRSAGGGRRVKQYGPFEREAKELLEIPGVRLPGAYEPAHLFALFFQVRRAFHHIYSYIAGRSKPAARLRAAVWESIFTHDMGRYRRALFNRMAEMTTLITGASGTGKELVARAIALSRYVPFDPLPATFAEDAGGGFHALNVSALSPTLVESELFGHRRGAFTGATADRVGWLETCPQYGTVFLDEVGEIDPLIQVKLLRVLQTREFQRLGDTEPRRFRGKLIAATNRELAAEMERGRFRRDFYYRLCSDQIRTPGLAEQLRDRPEELRDLVLFVARRVAGEEGERLANEVVGVVERSLGSGYAWPGNFRELEQCVRSVLVRREYRPVGEAVRGEARAGEGTWLEAVREGRLTADQLLAGYCRRVYEREGGYEQTARRLGVDRRTVKGWMREGE